MPFSYKATQTFQFSVMFLTRRQSQTAHLGTATIQNVQVMLWVTTATRSTGDKTRTTESRVRGLHTIRRMPLGSDGLTPLEVASPAAGPLSQSSHSFVDGSEGQGA